MLSSSKSLGAPGLDFETWDSTKLAPGNVPLTTAY